MLLDKSIPQEQPSKKPNLFGLSNTIWEQLQLFRHAHLSELGELEHVLIGKCVGVQDGLYEFQMSMYDYSQLAEWRYLDSMHISVPRYLLPDDPQEKTCFLGLFQHQQQAVWFVPLH